MSRASTLSLVLTASIFALPALPALGQPNPKAAISDPSLAGPDFQLQGEYAGWLAAPWGHVGLQVVALGDGKFEAMQYRGGLPGNGWDRAARYKLSGQMAIDALVLTGESGSFVVANHRATAYDLAGRELGTLVRIARRSPTLGLAPPPHATILFDGRTTEQLVNAKVTPDGLLQAGVLTKEPVGAFRMHLEFRTPYMPYARGQARGNSGVYIQQRYEVQILDSFGLEGLENECGGLYRQTRPDQNLCLPPLAWQTYDIWFTPPAFDTEGKKSANARLTVLHNGIPIHNDREVAAKTGGGKQEGPEPFPINLQDHGNPVVFRNLWIVPGPANFLTAASPSFLLAPTGSACENGYCGGQRRSGLFHRRRGW